MVKNRLALEQDIVVESFSFGFATVGGACDFSGSKKHGGTNFKKLGSRKSYSIRKN
jgi:hypothetical protein